LVCVVFLVVEDAAHHSRSPRISGTMTWR
jgi:hypothetical protein